MQSQIGIRAGIMALAVLMLFSACGHSSKNDLLPIASGYDIEYIPGASPAEGKTAFQVKITRRSDNSPATGLAGSVNIIPMMDMGAGMIHSTPVDIITESGTPGTYDCTVYYLMGGSWELQVKVGSDTATFHPTVDMAMMGSDTVKKSLYGPSDIVSGMSGTQYNTYYLFSDGMVSAATPTVKLYITQTKDNKMSFNPISTVSSPTGTVDSALVSASTDSTFVTGTVTASDDGNGHWSLPGISELLTMGTYTVYVKLEVNSENKTTNGAASSGTNAYATFKVTSH